jgi:surface antigen
MSQDRSAREGRLATRLTRWLRRYTAATASLPAVAIAGALAPAHPAVTAAADVPSAILCTGYAACAGYGLPSYRYADRGEQSYWSMTAGDECTNYVAYVESTVFGAPDPGYLLGNAGQWPASAAAHGVTVNDTPSVGAVAEWDAGAYGIGSMGHVAVVEQVGPHGRYIVISQQHISSDVDGFDYTRINAGFPAQSWQSWPSHFIHFPLAGTTSVGYYNARTGRVFARDTPSAGPVSATFRVGRPGDLPLTGDWTARRPGGGYYDQRTGTFRLQSGLGTGRLRPAFRFGPAGMTPFAGDWTGDGRDGIGYYDPQDGTFHLRDQLSGGRAEHSLAFGPPGMIPLVGDWTGDGRDSVGYYDPRTSRFVLRDGLGARAATQKFRFGPPGMVPLAGHWTGGQRSDVGYYNPGSGRFYLRQGLAGGAVARPFAFGPREMVPLAADWLG